MWDKNEVFDTVLFLKTTAHARGVLEEGAVVGPRRLDLPFPRYGSSIDTEGKKRPMLGKRSICVKSTIQTTTRTMLMCSIYYLDCEKDPS